ncbi:MAG: CRISPR-associated endonuclease Cas1 [Fimbriimonadales bacterium]
MPEKDLHRLPHFDDRLSFAYVEHATIDKYEKSVACHDAEGRTPIPAASLALLMLGPGTKITHAAIVALADCNCLVAWCGEQNVRFYAFGTGGTRSSAPLLRQAALVSEPATHLAVAKRMYAMRFEEPLDPSLSIQQLRGMEGRRVRDAYAEASARTGIPWTGRSYDRGQWDFTDPVNRALSAANSCLYGVCHAAIVSVGYSPAIGFIHTGKQLSFVYDIADLYKTEITIPLAFEQAADAAPDLERRVRLACRDLFREHHLLDRIVPDIRKALGVTPDEEEADAVWQDDPAAPASLWEPPEEVG